MKHVKLIFVAALLLLFTAFIDKSKPTEGLSIGNKAPDFILKGDTSQIRLSSLKSDYILLNFWASYDAPTRINNILLDHQINKMKQQIIMVSVSFDEFNSIYNETIKQDRIKSPYCYIDSNGKGSDIYNLYQLDKGFKSFLINKEGVIIATNITADQLSNYIK